MSPRNKYMKTDERKAATVDTVVKLAAEGNPSEITTTEIAKKMGVTQGALFKHFPTKEAIVQAVIEWVADMLLSRIDKAARSASSPLAAIEAMFYAHIDFVTEHPGAPRMLMGQLQRSKVTAPKKMATALMEFYRGRIQDQLDLGKLEDEVSKDLDSEAAATLMVGMIQGLVIQSLMINDVTRIRLEAPKVFSVYKRGIESRHD